MRTLSLLMTILLAFMPTVQANPLDWLGGGNASGSNEPEAEPGPEPEAASEDGGASQNGTTDPPESEPSEPDSPAGGPLDCIEWEIRKQTVTVADPLRPTAMPLLEFDAPFVDAEYNQDECPPLDP